MKQKIFKLFFSMLYISAFTFGGGYVIVGLMRNKYVEELKWITEEEMQDITAISQTAPGAIAVNAAVLTGWKVCGVWGMVSAVLGTVIPPLLILSVTAALYDLLSGNIYLAQFLFGMKACVAALVLNVALDLGITVIKQKSVYRILLLASAFISAFVLKINVIMIIIGTLVFSIIIVWSRKKGKDHDLS